MTAGLPLMKSVLMPLAKSFFIPFGLSAGMAATDAAMQREMFGSGTIASIISNKKMEDIMKIVKSLEEWGLLRFSPAFIRYINCQFIRNCINRTRNINKSRWRNN